MKLCALILAATLLVTTNGLWIAEAGYPKLCRHQSFTHPLLLKVKC